MKICFLLQRRFAYVGHAMALHLQSRYGVTDFCGYVYSRSSLKFLTSQKEIKYSKLLLDEEVHARYKNEKLDIDYLKKLEQEYGIPHIWPFIEIDRLIRYGLFIRDYPHDTSPYSHEEMLRVLQTHAKAITDFFETEKPDCLVLSVVANIGTMLLYHIAKKKGVKVLFISTTRVKNQYTVTEQTETLTYIDQAVEEIARGGEECHEQKKLAETFLREFRKAPTPHSVTESPKTRPVTRRKQFSFLQPRKLLFSIKWFLFTVFEYILDPHKDDYDVIKPWHYFWDRLKRKARVLWGFNDLYDPIDVFENFAFFPLQHEPEMSISLFAPFYNDQLWVIKQIAKSLPIDFKLYVKEHPTTFGYRPRSFYKELKKIPNLKLIDPTKMSFEITKHAKLILTLTGTAGFEALLLKKPVIVFGDVFYSKLPMVKRVYAIADLPLFVKEQLQHHVHDESALLNLITAIYKESADINLIQIWNIEGDSQMEKKKNAVIPLTDLIASKLNLKPIDA
ncbi:MAG: hypothetical protein Q7R93_03400 [bacterium]|nr:hypothetical protein [bacterium]